MLRMPYSHEGGWPLWLEVSGEEAWTHGPEEGGVLYRGFSRVVSLNWTGSSSEQRIRTTALMLPSLSFAAITAATVRLVPASFQGPGFRAGQKNRNFKGHASKDLIRPSFMLKRGCDVCHL